MPTADELAQLDQLAAGEAQAAAELRGTLASLLIPAGLAFLSWAGARRRRRHAQAVLAVIDVESRPADPAPLVCPVEARGAKGERLVCERESPHEGWHEGTGAPSGSWPRGVVYVWTEGDPPRPRGEAPQ